MQNSTHPEPNRNGAAPTLAERLAPFLITNAGARVADARTNAGVADTARMFADLAARLAAVDPATLPRGAGVSVVVSFQPHLPLDGGPYGEEREAAETKLIDALTAQLAPGVTPERDVADDSVLYIARARVGGGMGFSALTGATPTEYEAAMMLRRKAERAHRPIIEPYRGAGRSPGTPQGSDVDSGVRVATCSCKEYASTPGTADEVRRRHLQHRTVAVRRTLAVAVAQEPPRWERARRGATADCDLCRWCVPAGTVNRVAALAGHLAAKHTDPDSTTAAPARPRPRRRSS